MWGVCSRISGDGLNVYVRQVLEKIQAEYASRLSIEDCAESMQVSASYYFCQVFKKYLQVSPKRYMQERELKLSK